jgi:hypothetical protein
LRHLSHFERTFRIEQFPQNVQTLLHLRLSGAEKPPPEPAGLRLFEKVNGPAMIRYGYA